MSELERKRQRLCPNSADDAWGGMASMFGSPPAWWLGGVAGSIVWVWVFWEVDVPVRVREGFDFWREAAGEALHGAGAWSGVGLRGACVDARELRGAGRLLVAVGVALRARCGGFGASVR